MIRRSAQLERFPVDGCKATGDNGFAMTVDEELSRLEEDLRRLKIEYEAYFNGGSQRPPNELASRVEQGIKRYVQGPHELTFRQRFRLSQLAQSFAVHNELWRKKMRIKEEGPPQSTVASVGKEASVTVAMSDPEEEPEKIEELLGAVIRAQTEAGAAERAIDPNRFAEFIRARAAQCKQELGCSRVAFTISVKDGRVRMRTAPAD